MAIERTTGGASVIDVLDRVLDKGIVIDAWVHLSLVGIDLITVEARVGVASIDTYLKYSESVAQVPAVSRTAAVISQEAENAALRAQLAATLSGATPPRGARRRRTPQSA
jgi:gas vesicle structural protein